MYHIVNVHPAAPTRTVHDQNTPREQHATRDYETGARPQVIPEREPASETLRRVPEKMVELNRRHAAEINRLNECNRRLAEDVDRLNERHRLHIDTINSSFDICRWHLDMLDQLRERNRRQADEIRQLNERKADDIARLTNWIQVLQEELAGTYDSSVFVHVDCQSCVLAVSSLVDFASDSISSFICPYIYIIHTHAHISYTSHQICKRAMRESLSAHHRWRKEQRNVMG